MQTRYKTTDKYQLIDTEGGAILTPDSATSMFILGIIEYDIWKLLDGKNSVADIVEILSERYEGNPEEIRNDTVEFIEKMAAAGICTPV